MSNKKQKPKAETPAAAAQPDESETLSGTDLAPPPTASVRTDRVLWVSVLAYATLLGTMWWLYSTQTDTELNRLVQEDQRRRRAAAVANAGPVPLKVTVFDEVTTPESSVVVQVKYERDGPGMINPDRERLPVIIGMNRPEGGPQGTTETKKARTDKDGMARATFVAPKTSGTYQLFSYAEEKKEYAPRETSVPPLLFVHPAGHPILICDLDDTVTDGESLDVSGIDPRPDAAAVLTRLSAKYGIVYLTARDEGLLDRSRAWLEKHGFPRGPILCRDWKLHNLNKQGEFKTKVLKRLRSTFTNIQWGIGNAKSDREAYMAVQLPHIIIGDGGDETKDGVRQIGLEHWKDVEKYISGP